MAGHSAWEGEILGEASSVHAARVEEESMSRRPLVVATTVAFALVASLSSLLPARATGPASSLGKLGVAGGELALEDVDTRQGSVAPTAQQRQSVSRLDAHATWSDFGTPASLISYGDFLASGLQGSSAAAAAKGWIEANRSLLGLTSTQNLELLSSARLGDSNGYALLFGQRFGNLKAAEGGQLTVGATGTPASGWKIAYASSTLTRDTSLAAAPRLSATAAWARAAADVGQEASASSIGNVKKDRNWSVFGAEGLSEAQRARLVAVPTPGNGVRPAFETLLVNNEAGHWTAYQHFIDAATGDVLIRKNLVEHSHPPSDVFSGVMPPVDGACAPRHGPWEVAADERVGSVVAGMEALVTTNDAVIKLYRNGVVVASQDTLFSPEALVYDPADSGQGIYEFEVCDFVDGESWTPPTNYVGGIVFNPADTGIPYPPMWKVFPAYGELGQEVHPWMYPSDDIRELWCWESTEGFPPQPVTGPGGELCDREVQNLASRAPWDHDVRLDAPTFTTKGNNARSAEAWTSPFTPGPFGFQPVSPTREYVYPWNNTWHEADCFTPFVPGQSHDISAAVTNLFAMHNRMHDWSYFLGFTERRWNAQDSNFGTGGTLDRDPLLGDAQAGALTGGAPTYTGRDNANMISLPDGVPPITNMYLWQPLAGAFYAPCVDGDFDMAVIGHEFGHLTENRMIGKGGTRSGHHAGAMGESFGDFNAAEYLNEYGFVPVTDENPFSVGAYVTGNKDRAIRNYGMNFPRTGTFPTPGVSLVRRTGPLVNPLNFSNMGYDIVGQQVHANGEIWSATNFDIRQALVDKYNATFPAGDQQLQDECADGQRFADECPGNRRWIQIVFDAMLLMPVAPSMLDARDAYLAADMMRFGGDNQAEIWLAFARRGFGVNAFGTNSSPESQPTSDTDPRPDFESPLEGAATITFNAVAPDEGNAPVSNARIYVGHYEARVSPVADTDPATNATDPPTPNNLDEVARFAPGEYEFVAQAPGYGHVRFRETFTAGETRTLTVAMPTNWASRHKGATATGDGDPASLPDLVDDTEATNWDDPFGGPDVNVSRPQVTVDLAGAQPRTFNRVQVSAMLFAQNRFTALRQFEIRACTPTIANRGCRDPNIGFRTIFTSQGDAFPGFNPRPVAPEMILRNFDVPSTSATHVQIRVLHNQCTGNPSFQGEQDQDPLNATDCRFGSSEEPVEIIGDLPDVLAPRGDEVHIAELQVFSQAPVVTGRG
jgi:extracellular elastinolytic metalloproteinase